MTKYYLTVVFCIVEINAQIISTTVWDPGNLDYCPLKIGNKWIYDYYTLEPYQLVKKELFSITADTIINNRSYFVYNSDYGRRYYRVDSSSNKVFIFNEFYNRDDLVYNLAKGAGDTVRLNFPSYYLINAIDTIVYFNLIKSRQEQFYFYLPFSHKRDLVMDIGLTYYIIIEEGGYERKLVGAIIDNIVYGDTSLISNLFLETNKELNFYLSQNYPNPFNPATKIKFEIPSQARNDITLVTLKVYDVLGNEIAILVDEEKPAGSYEVNFDGKNLTSGVYFYTLTAGDFSSTKKLVLLK